jgi:hypothetical protein
VISSPAIVEAVAPIVTFPVALNCTARRREGGHYLSISECAAFHTMPLCHVQPFNFALEQLMQSAGATGTVPPPPPPPRMHVPFMMPSHFMASKLH